MYSQSFIIRPLLLLRMLLACAAASFAADSHAAATFRSLGYLDPSSQFSQAHGVSADGQVVVGESSNNRNNAVRWSSAAGLQSLGSFPVAGFSSYAYAASSDGSIVIGTALTTSVSPMTAGLSAKP